MPELIDKQAALDIAMSYCPDDDGCCSKSGHDLREMLDEIEELPIVYIDDMAFNIQNEIQAKKPSRTVEITFVRHGRWIQQQSPNGGSFNCSECGHEFTVPCSEMIDPRDYVCYLDDYCGKCGARMDADHIADVSKKVGGDDNG